MIDTRHSTVSKRIVITYVLSMVIIGYGLYAPLLRLYFNDEDVYVIRSALDMKEFGNLAFSLFSREGATTPPSRPLTFLYGLAYYKLFSLDNSTFGYAANIGIHIMNSFLVCLISLRLTRRMFLSFFASSIFLLHNVGHHALMGITYVSESLMSFFMYVSLLSYMLFSEKEKSLLYIVSIMSFLAALGWKETAVVTPLWLLAFAIISNRDSRQVFKKLVSLVPHFMVLVAYLTYRLYLVGMPPAGTYYHPTVSVSLWTNNLFQHLLSSIGITDPRLIYDSQIAKVYLLLALAVVVCGLTLSTNEYKRLYLYSLFLCILPLLPVLPLKKYWGMYLYSSLLGFSLVFSGSTYAWFQVIAKNRSARGRKITSYTMVPLCAVALVCVTRHDMSLTIDKHYAIGSIARDLLRDIKSFYPRMERGSSIYFLNTRGDIWKGELKSYFSLFFKDACLDIKMDRYDKPEKVNGHNLYVFKYYQGHFYDMTKDLSITRFNSERWKYELPPVTEETMKYESCLDFNQEISLNQLGDGWFLEPYRKNLGREKIDKWMSRAARVYLRTEQNVRHIVIEGYAPFPNGLNVRVNDSLLQTINLRKDEPFQVRTELDSKFLNESFLVIDLTVANTIIPKETDKNSRDERELGLIISYICLE